MIGFVSFDASTGAGAHSVFWDSIVKSLLHMDIRIVGGYFNNIELASDVHVDGSLRTSSIAPCEREACFFLRLEVQTLGTHTLLITWRALYHFPGAFHKWAAIFWSSLIGFTL